MDSFTQIALGASVGAVIGGRKNGRKSALLGAILGTIPDLDTFLYLNADPVTAFTYHRGFSHSLLFTILGVPIFAWLISKIKWFGWTFKDKRLHLIIFFCFLTHIILDGLTVYGTQIFWPLQSPPVGLGSIFIIDPLYTIPLSAGLIWFLVSKNTKAIKLALSITSLYLIWGIATQTYITSLIPKMSEQKLLVQTTPFNTFLWRILIVDKNQYKVGYYSIFDDTKDIKFKTFPNKAELAFSNQNGQRLNWFTKGFYQARLEGQQIIVTDLRMGLEPNDYVFSFNISDNKESTSDNSNNTKRDTERTMIRLKSVWQRIWDENITL